MRGKWGNVKRIQIIHGVHLIFRANLPFPPDADHNMLMPVLFKARISSRGDLKIPEVELCGFALVTDDYTPYHVGPISSLKFISPGLYPMPFEIAPVSVKPALVFRFFFRHANLLQETPKTQKTTILFSESPARAVSPKASAVFSTGNRWVTNFSALTVPSSIISRASAVSVGPQE